MTAPATAHFELDPETDGRLRRLAELRSHPPQRLMQEAIAQYVDREEARDRLNRDMLESWDEYRTTGLHATGEEVDAWLRKLEAGEAAAPPECHE